jgi:hypothetical protein
MHALKQSECCRPISIYRLQLCPLILSTSNSPNRDHWIGSGIVISLCQKIVDHEDGDFES